MIIVGDIACPTEALSKQLKNLFDSNASIFKEQSIVLNLEGLLGEEELLLTTVPVLYSHSSFLNSLEHFSSVTACLANNHILDLPENFAATTKLLAEKHINYGGAANTKEQAHAPIYCKDGAQDVIVFNECWDFLLYNQTNPTAGVYIATLQFDTLVKRVQNAKVENKNATIIVYVHWSLDFETLPYPMYRQLAQALIDAGCNVVVGCHSHCVQGGEAYNNGYIVYGLGNFFLPNRVFANGSLKAPALAAMQLVLEYDIAKNTATCHWFKYAFNNNQHTIDFVASNPFNDCSILKKYSPYQSMSESEYVPFFKNNRRKKILIPLFKSYHNSAWLVLQTKALKTRATIARVMAKLNLIKWGS
jgi:hypothetical protein